MKRAGRLIMSLGIAWLASACAMVLGMTSFYWAMTEQFYLFGGLYESLVMSAVALVASLVGALVLLTILSLAQRVRPIALWAAALLGGLLFAAPVALFDRAPWTGLFFLPAGIAAGLILARTEGRPVRGPGATALLMGLTIWLVLLAIPAGWAWQEERREARSASASLLSDRILGGAALDSELWLFDLPGKVVSFRHDDLRPTVRVSSGVTALATDGSTMWALVAPRSYQWKKEPPIRRFRVVSFAGGRWRFHPWQVEEAYERPVAIALRRQGVVAVGPKRVYLLGKDEAGSAKALALSEPIELAGQVSSAMVGETLLYVGTNIGEWGGQLFRIDLATGRVTTLQGIDDPVTGLVADREAPPCLFASLGVSHLGLWRGRVVRICGDRLETVLEVPVLPIGKRIERALSSRARQFPPDTEPVFGLAPAPGGFWAVTPRSLYHWQRGELERWRRPGFEDAHGLAVSTALPDVVLVATDANATRSVSGYTPLVFAK